MSRESPASIPFAVDENYWDRVAADYDGEIFNSFASDRTGILLRRLDEFADRSLAAADAGCGVGKYLPALAARFARVDAYDLSAKLLKQARQVARGLDTVRFFKRNFAARSARFEPVRFALCTNVLIMADQKVREAILRNLGRLVEPGGHALFLVPSIESALLAHHRMVEWNLRDGLSHESASRSSVAPAARAGRVLADGLLPIDGVRTKHWLREEIAAQLGQSGFQILHADKIEYGWDTEFESPPEWMEDPYPWDWLITAQREDNR